MNTRLTKLLQVAFIGVLMLHMGLCGCVTGMMWQKDSSREKVLSDVAGKQFSVMILDEDRIAVLPMKKDGESLNNLATIYKFKKATYESIKPSIKRVQISESITLSSKKKQILHSSANFGIELEGGDRIALEYTDATLTQRSEKEVPFDDPRIYFHRTVYGEKGADFTWLWKVPLTPVTVAADAALIVASPLILLLVAFSG